MLKTKLTDKQIRLLEHLIGITVILMITVRYYFVYPFNVDSKDYYQWARCINLGMLPYRDFNMLQTPLSAYFSALFYKINTSIFFIHVLPLTITVFITIYFSAKMISCRVPNSRIFPIYLWAIISMVICSALYNMMSLMFWVIGLYAYTVYKAEKKTCYLALAGVSAGLCFFTKQNTAALMIAAFGVIFISNWIKDKAKAKTVIREFLTLWLSFLAVMEIGLMIFFIQGNLNEFFEYTFFSTKDFVISNADASVIVLVGIIVVAGIIGFISKEIEMGISGAFAALMAFPIVNLHHLIFTFLFISVIADINISTNNRKAFSVLLALSMFIAQAEQTIPIVLIDTPDADIKAYVFEIKESDKIIDYLKDKNASKYHIIDVWSGYFSIYYDRYDKFYDLFLDGNLGKRTQTDVIKETIGTEKGSYFLVRITKYKDDEANKLVSDNAKKAIKYIQDNCKYECSINEDYSVYKIL